MKTTCLRAADLQNGYKVSSIRTRFPGEETGHALQKNINQVHQVLVNTTDQKHHNEDIGTSPSSTVILSFVRLILRLHR
jgi:hypothetical protein